MWFLSGVKHVIWTSGGSHAEGIGGSIRTSRHSALLEVVDHSRCRKMFAVRSHEQSPGRRRVPRAITRKKTSDERSRNRSPKT